MKRHNKSTILLFPVLLLLITLFATACSPVATPAVTNVADNARSNTEHRASESSKPAVTKPEATPDIIHVERNVGDLSMTSTLASIAA